MLRHRSTIATAPNLKKNPPPKPNSGLRKSEVEQGRNVSLERRNVPRLFLGGICRKFNSQTEFETSSNALWNVKQIDTV